MPTLQCIHDLQLENLDFEYDSKLVVDNVHHHKDNVSYFDAILNERKYVLSNHFKNSHVEFVRKLTSKTAPCPTRTITSLVDFHIFLEIATYIQHLIINENWLELVCFFFL